MLGEIVTLLGEAFPETGGRPGTLSVPAGTGTLASAGGPSSLRGLLLRFFDKLTPPAPAGSQKSAADSASLADFGNEDVAAEEAEIQSGLPLQIPQVPPVPTLSMQAGNGQLAAAAAPRHNDHDADSGA